MTDKLEQKALDMLHDEYDDDHKLPLKRVAKFMVAFADQFKSVANPAAQPAPFAMPEELMGGAVKLIRPTDLRNRIGMFMVEEYNLHIGSKVDAGKVQDMIEKFVSRELDAQPRKENP